MSKVIAVNAGSSSLKFKLFEMPEEKVICSGIADRIGHEDALFRINVGDHKLEKVLPIMDHAVAVQMLLDALISEKVVASLNEIKGVGHRIVQGGYYFSSSCVLDQKTEDIIESLIPLAPLHNAAHLVGYRAFKKALPEVGHVAVFDTAFHQTMEPEDYMYACPYEYYENNMVRKYGAHGTSHQYLAQEAEKYLVNVSNPHKVITCHIGSGASLCAIRDLKCVTTSMGLTPLAGVMMGTRTGDIDGSVMPYLVKQTGKDAETLYQEFNKKSGLLGISGISNDTRDVEQAANEGNERAILAIKMYCRRVADYIGQYYARLGGCDLIVFSAGVGENSDLYRKLILDNVKQAFGIEINDELNAMMIRGKEGMISTVNSKIPVVVIPTDEEIMIARDICTYLGI